MFRFYEFHSTKPTSDRRLNPGPAITIVDDLIPASDRAHQIRVRRRPSFKSNDIAFQKAAALCRFQFWVVYITNTGLRRLRHDSPIFTDKLGSINCGRQQSLFIDGSRLLGVEGWKTLPRKRCCPSSFNNWMGCSRGL